MFLSVGLPRAAAGTGLAAVACAAAVAVSACATDAAPMRDGTETVAAKLGGTPGPVAPASMDQSPKTLRPEPPAQLAVGDVTVASHGGYDRLVVTLHGAGQPGWFVDYVPSPMQETIGKPIKVSGNAFLNINIDGTVSRAEAGLASPAPIDISAASSNVVDLVNVGTIDDRTQLILGLRTAAPYSVQLASDPTRLIIDISTS